MDKVTKFLEQNVQWLVLGVGGLFLLLMVWYYVINPAVTVSVGRETEVSPGEVDKLVFAEAEKLKSKMDPNPQPILDRPVPDYIAAFEDAMQLKAAPDVRMAGAWTPVRNKDFTRIDDGGDKPILTADKSGLPKLPPVANLATTSGRGLFVAQPMNPAQPGPAVAAGAMGPQQLDIDYVSVGGVITGQDIAAAFTAAKLPPNIATTYFVEVELVRREVLPDGTFGKEEIIPPLAMLQMPKPPAANNLAEALQYNEWAQKNQDLIIQPVFYQLATANGQPWQRPGAPAAVVNPVPTPVDLDPANFDPALVNPRDVAKLTPEQRRIWQQYMKQKQEEERARKAAERKANQPQPGVTPRPGGGRVPPAEQYVPRDPDRPETGMLLAQATPRRPIFTPPEIYEPEFFDDGGGMGRQQQVPGASGVPAGFWDPSKVGNIDIWAHDDSAKAGKSYQYKLRYKVRNPLWRTQGVAENEKDTTEYAIVSQDSAWTPVQRIPTRVNFAIASNATANSNSVRVEVFVFAQGQLKKVDVNKQPGDQLVVKVGDQTIDTQYTIVDVRTDHSLLMDGDGRVVRRSKSEDDRNAEIQELRKQASAPVLPTPVGATGMGSQQF